MFDRILSSDLMVGAQVMSVMSYVGTRVHFRLALLLAGSAAEPPAEPPVIGNRWQTWCRVRDPGAMFLATASSTRRRAQDADDNISTAVFAREPQAQAAEARQMGQSTYVRGDINDFMMAEGTREQIPFEAYTRLLLADKNNDFEYLKRVIDATDTGNPKMWETNEFQIVGVEIPLFNPFCMFEGPATDKGTYKFFTTQCDFVALAMQTMTDDPTETRACVVMGEFKTLMERTNPWDRVKNARTLSQTMANAALFEMQTGVKVDYAMQIYVTRREAQVFYASCTHLHDFDRNDNDDNDGPLGERQKLKQLKRNISTQLRLKGPEARKGVAHYDGVNMCVFMDGFWREDGSTRTPLMRGICEGISGPGTKPNSG
jgi:hypothetical protein